MKRPSRSNAAVSIARQRLEFAPRCLLAALLVFSSWCQAEPPATQPTDEIVIAECLVIKPVGRYGRVPIHTDAIQALIAAGRWTAPKIGDDVKLPDGSVQTWQQAKIDKDGWITHEALNGGYAYATVDSELERPMILEAAGHGMVYVNGQPRVGDPYETGYVLIPVLLKHGSNEFLFHCSRGHLRAKLSLPKARAIFNPRDPTFPDLVVGRPDRGPAALPIMNATSEPLRGLAVRASFADGDAVVSPVAEVMPLASRKISFEVPSPVDPKPGQLDLKLELVSQEGGRSEVLDTVTLPLRVRKPDEVRRRTFRSGIDGSVQYYALNPARPAEPETAAPALFLTLHGAGVEGLGQAEAYAPKTWGHIVAPTNRRPYGFDWEDWGRLDAMEVLDIAQKQLGVDPRRIYLTGHSMGGHGVWQIGATFPDRFAAIGPSAGWISFWTYAGAEHFSGDSAIERMLGRASSPSETLDLSRNYAQYGVYILHGEKDDNVPVQQARTMVRRLARFHRDFAYHEVPGAGHWWSSACVDWPPMFDFFKHHERPQAKDVHQVAFTTASPGVSASCNWATIDAQIHPLTISSLDVRYDPETGRFSGRTRNVARLALDLAAFTPKPSLSIELDEAKPITDLPWPKDGGRLWLIRDGEQWSLEQQPSSTVKRPYRYGPFKDAFRNRVMFVYGTKGTPEEIAWASAKARYDAETFWYRGNASVDVVPDTAFNAAQTAGRNVILYGNADTNQAWAALLADSPVQVRRLGVDVGERKLTGEDLACLLVRPRPGDDTALVGAVSGAGLSGMHATDRLPYFLSGVAYPDCTVLRASVLTDGVTAVQAAGFFGDDWSVTTGDFAWVSE